ncbi:MAG: hypothetical protein ABFD92_03945 [Planctomycetaceae bacterium]|nr:hypothetical protein [Planctomycetaceae bacterium]
MNPRAGTSRSVLWVLVSAVALCAGGCLRQEKLAPGEFDRYWTIDADPTVGVSPALMDIGGRQVPSVWTIRRTQDAQLAATSLTQVKNALQGHAPKVELNFTAGQAQRLAALLEKTRVQLDNLAEVLAGQWYEDPHRWAQKIASALAAGQRVIRAAEGRGAPGLGGKAGIAARPILDMLLTQFNERIITAPMDDDDYTQFRQVLTQITLQIGFAWAGKIAPPDLRPLVMAELDRSDRREDLEDRLAELLERYYRRAPSAPSTGELPRAAEKGLRIAILSLGLVAELVRQWDRLDHVTLTFYRSGEDLWIAIDIQVSPGRRVSIAYDSPLAPTFVFSGASRVVVVPRRQSDSLAVLFPPAGPGGVQVHFGGLMRSLRLVVPVDTSRLRQITFYRDGLIGAPGVTNVTIAMYDVDETGDARRLLSVQHRKTTVIRRTAMSVETPAVESVWLFNFVTPQRRYFFEDSRGE